MFARWTPAVSLVALFIAACGPASTPRTAPAPASAPPPSAEDHAAAAQLDADADAIFTATVVHLGPAPAFVSGDVPATQSVTVRIASVQKGALSVGEELTVDVVVVASAPFVVAGPTGIPALDPTALSPGRTLTFWTERAGQTLRAWRMSAG